MKKLGILTSGGDAPGMNAAIRSCVRTAVAEGCEIYGILRGYEGLLNEEICPLTARSVGGIVHLGGTCLKTARCPDFFQEKMQKRAVSILKKDGIEGLIIIGGDGSMVGAERLSNFGTATVTIPGTIDNDMCGTDYTIGFDTAVNTALEAVRRIRDTAASHNRAAVVEVMGRSAGYIALESGLACGAEYILVPEVSFEREKLAADLKKQMIRGRTNSIIICAEGAADGKKLAEWLHDRTGIDMCATILGYIQRGGAPTAIDSACGAILGDAGVRAILSGCNRHLIGMYRNRVRILPYEKAKEEKRALNMEVYDLARKLGIQADIKE